MKIIKIEIYIDEKEEASLEKEVEHMNKTLEDMGFDPDWTIEKELISGSRKCISKAMERWGKNEPTGTAIPMSSKNKTTGAL